MKHIVSFSGGKDSTLMLLLMIEKGMPSGTQKESNLRTLCLRCNSIKAQEDKVRVRL